MTPPFSSVVAALDRRLDPTSQAPLVVAFSGGGDSLALLHLTLDWARDRGRSLLALTVDHGLHPDSARWTAAAGERARGLGLAWRGLVWVGVKPTTGLPAAARRARHALLADAARDAGARVLLMGHTQSDIAENEIMRAVDAPGLGRLREWAPSPVWPEGRGVFLLRPLLGMQREPLRAFLRTRNETWLDDPANDDLRHPRIRARRALGQTPTPSLAAPSIEPSRALTLAQALVVRDSGAVSGSRRDFRGATVDEAASVLAAVLLCVSGGNRPPRREPLRRLLSQIRESQTSVATLCGCRVDMGPGEIVIARSTPRRGQTPNLREPSDWIAQRLAAACGLISDETAVGTPLP